MNKRQFGIVTGFLWGFLFGSFENAQAFILANQCGHRVIAFVSIQRLSENTEGTTKVGHYPLLTYRNLENSQFLNLDFLPTIRPSDEVHIRIYNSAKTAEIKEILKLRLEAQAAFDLPRDSELKESLNQFALVKAKTPRETLPSGRAIIIKREAEHYTLN